MAGNNRLVAEYAGVLSVKRSGSNRHDRGWMDARPPKGAENERQLSVGFAREKNYVDEIMCPMQGTSEEAAIVRFGSLPVRVGMAGCRSGSRGTYRIPYANKKVCQRVG